MTVMVDDKVQAIKRFIRTYAVAVVATVILIIILAILIIARYNALSSIRDLSKLNPLITSEQNELVAGKDLSGVIEVAKVDNTKDNDKKDITDNSGTKSTSTTTGGGSSSGGSSSGSSSGGGGSSESGGGGGSGGEGGGDNQQESFSASIHGSITLIKSKTKSILGLGARCEYEFTANILGHNSPGTVTYRWEQSNGLSSQGEVSFDDSDSQKTIVHEWEGNIPRDSTPWVKLKLLTPNQEERGREFNEGCG